ncbi:uncharacterized protein LOC128827366 [Malaclemys terrapin pileata]|uniref:uncharacterized protein LOC128827366 n=1 Tax=Malaclemys terrapin pileata TaxID=2991368 RepID=UPI0023A851A4|nr:uncharacterized protein LOC128827366 [Malaclemys terrapin pileata]
MPRSGAAWRRDAFWGCRASGHIKRHCPLRRTEERLEEVPVDPGGSGLEVEVAAGTEGTPKEVRTQTVAGTAFTQETQTDWAQQEAGTQFPFGGFSCARFCQAFTAGSFLPAPDQADGDSPQNTAFCSFCQAFMAGSFLPAPDQADGDSPQNTAFCLVRKKTLDPSCCEWEQQEMNSYFCQPKEQHKDQVAPRLMMKKKLKSNLHSFLPQLARSTTGALAELVCFPAGRLCQAPIYQIQVPSRVTAQQGLCVLLPCNFTANFKSSGVAYKYWFLRDDKDTSPAVATTDPDRTPREPGGRIRLVGNASDDCSLLISDVRAGDRDRYYFRFVKGDFKYSYQVTHPLVDVTELKEQPVLEIPEVLFSGQLVNVTCQAPGTCSGTPPHITWTGGFNYTARNVSVTLANGSISYSSELSFTPAPGDDGKELICTVTYPAVVGVCTRRSVRLQVDSGFSRTLVVPLAVCGSLVLVGAGAAVAWKVVKGRQGSRGPARAGRCQGTGDGQVSHSSEQQASTAPSHRQDATREGGALEKKGRAGGGRGGGRCYRERGDGEQFTEEHIYVNI